MKEYQLAIIGAGPGGYVAAIKAAQLGLEVSLIEKEKLGGTCLNWGCIPTKALTASCEVLRNIKQGPRFGIKVKDFEVDWQGILKHKESTVKRLVKGVEYLIDKNQIDLISARASFKGAGVLELNAEGEKEELRAENIIIASGSKPLLIDDFNYDAQRIITSKELLSLKELPASILIVGAGVIGCEFASILATLGVDITLVDIRPRLLADAEQEISQHLARSFKRNRINMELGREIQELVNTGTGIEASLDNQQIIEAEMALLAIGRIPYTEGLNLEAIGLETEKGAISVNEYLQTEVEGVYAIGDVTDKIQLAHLASKQGIVAVQNITGKEQKMDYKKVPSAVFTHPEIGSLGLSSQEAQEQGLEIEVGRFFFKGNAKAVTMKETQGLVKIIAEAKSAKIIGAHIIGAHAADLIHEIAVAMQGEMTIEELAETIHVHPTLAETVLEAAEDTLGEAIHS